MKNFSLLCLILLLLLVGSCIPSLHGIVTDENRITDDRILGIWSTSESPGKTIDGSMPPKITRATDRTKPAYSHYGLGWTFERIISVTYKINDTQMVHTLMPNSHLPENISIIEIDSLPFYTLIHREIVEGDTMTYDMIVSLTRINQHLLMDFQPNSESHRIFQGRFGINFIQGHTFARIEFEKGDLQISPLHSEYIEELIKQKRIRLKHEIIGEDGIILTASSQELRDFISNYSDDPRLFDEVEVLKTIL